MLPFFYFLAVSVNMFSIFYDGSEREYELRFLDEHDLRNLLVSVLYFHLIPLWGIFIISIGSGLLTALVVKYYMAPRLKAWILSTPDP